MKKQSSVYICEQCGYHSPVFMGKCPECNSWNSLVEQITGSVNSAKKSPKLTEIINISDVENNVYDRLSTNIKEFDRVLGGGIVRGSVILVSGDPGIGKSTLLTQIALCAGPVSSVSQVRPQPPRRLAVDARDPSSEPPANLSLNTLYVAGEESAQQIKLRVTRIDPKADLAVIQETDVDVITAVIENIKPTLVIVDSIQTIQTADLESAAGSISQVRESAHRLQKTAKSLHIPIIIVGHITKDGAIAGPKTLEHLVDVVLNLEGDFQNSFRILRTTKNRFGATDEVGIFEMEEGGMKEVDNPSKIFLKEKVNAPGSAVTSILTGFRPMLLEIQALVTKTYSPIPRRVGTGIDNNRLQLLVAVLVKRCKLPLYDQDIFVNVTGGIRIVEPASDLAICLAIYSSFKDLTLPTDSVLIGEVGLLGELRVVRKLEQRLNEAKKLGFTKPISFANAKSLENAIAKAFKI